MNEIVETYIEPIYFRLIRNDEPGANKIYILIHGWLGNETSMSIFSSALPQLSTTIYPRGIVKLKNNQYGWIDFRNSTVNFEEYELVATKLINSIIGLQNAFDIQKPEQKINLIGFSQGAAMCAVLSILYPELFNKVAILAGFLPAYPPKQTDKDLSSLHYYVAHGTEDQLVSFDKSLEIKNYLEQRQAKVHFCKEDIGHKVGKNCLNNLKKFFSAEENLANEPE
jgi:predicted esterase